MEEALEEVLGQGKKIFSFPPPRRLLDILFADDDLTAMYLTDRKNNITRERDDHDDLEVLLESFSKQVEEIVNEAENIEVRPISKEGGFRLTHNLSSEQCSIDTRNRGVDLRLEPERFAGSRLKSSADLIHWALHELISF